MTNENSNKAMNLVWPECNSINEHYLVMLANTLANIDFEQLQKFTEELLDDAQQGKIFHLLGNGGCASVCQHAVTDFSIPSCYAATGIRARTAMDNTGRLLMWINDTSWDESLCHYIRQEVGAGDTVLFLSSSGAKANSKNLLNAAYTAQEIGAKVSAVVQNESAPLSVLSEAVIILPNEVTVEVYETAAEAILHQLRILCEKKAGEKK